MRFAGDFAFLNGFFSPSSRGFLSKERFAACLLLVMPFFFFSSGTRKSRASVSAVGYEGASGNAKAIDDVVLEGTVVDGAGATRWASILKDGDLDSEEVAEAHGLLCAFDEVLGDVFSGFGEDGVIDHLARLSLLRESAFDLWAERNDLVMLFEPL